MMDSARHIARHEGGVERCESGRCRRFVDAFTYRVRRASSCALPWSSTAKRELMNSSVTAAAEDALPSPRAPVAAAEPEVAPETPPGPLASSVRKRLHWKKPPVLLLWRDQSCMQIQQKSWRHLRQVMWLHPSSFSMAVEHRGQRFVLAAIHSASAMSAPLPTPRADSRSRAR